MIIVQNNFGENIIQIQYILTDINEKVSPNIAKQTLERKILKRQRFI